MPSGYYVTALDGTRIAWLVGPFETHREAIKMVGAVKRLTTDYEPRATFWAFGTAQFYLPGEGGHNLPQGTLNHRLAYAGRLMREREEKGLPRLDMGAWRL